MTRAMMLCAGLGTRLGDLSLALPKPLMPVCDIPIARYGIALCRAHGITDIVINLHHHADLIARELGDGSAFGVSIRYSREPELLDTGGGLKRALALLDPDGTDEPFVSMNGKLIFDVDLGAVLAAHRADRDVLGTMVVRKVDDAAAWGAVDVEERAGRRRVRNILGAGGYMFGGIHVTRPSVIRRLPDGKACMVRQGYLPWIRAGGEVGAFVAPPGYFAEHSTPARYLASNLALLSGAPLAHPPGPLTGIDSSAHIDATARIVHPVRVGAGAHISAGAKVGPHAVVGAHAVVDPDSVIERAVLWPGARAAGRVADAVVTSRGVFSAAETKTET